MHVGCPQLGIWTQLDPMLQPGIPALVEDYRSLPATAIRPEASAWSGFVRSVMEADEAIWRQAKESAPAAAGILEFLRANKTAVYMTAGGLFLLAVLRRSN